MAKSDTKTTAKKEEKRLPIGIDKPICFFDLETTGLDIAKDRIVSISVIKLFPNGTRDARSMIINPTILIPKESTDVHGITNDVVKGKPTFKQISKGIKDFIANSYIAGFNNNHFDNALLSEEFSRCGIMFPTLENKSIDVGTIFKKKEERTLIRALKFYCNEELEGAHNSLNDTLATVNVFIGQLEMYPDIAQMNIDEIVEYCKYDDRVDFAGKIGRDADGDYTFNFGQHKGKKINADDETAKYAKWMLANDFTQNTKMYVQKALGLLEDDAPKSELQFRAKNEEEE